MISLVEMVLPDSEPRAIDSFVHALDLGQLGFDISTASTVRYPFHSAGSKGAFLPVTAFMHTFNFNQQFSHPPERIACPPLEVHPGGQIDVRHKAYN